MKAIDRCPICSKVKDVLFETSDRIFYRCGHSDERLAVEELKKQFSSQFTSIDGALEAYPYQKEGIEFAIATGLNLLLADAMGLGKTIQSLLAVKNSNPEDVYPCAVVQKSATTYNWIREIHTWVDNSPTAVYPIIGTQPFIPQGFKFYIISMDSLSRNLESLRKLGLKAIIVDECHSFKDEGSKRTISLISLLTGVERKGENRGGITKKLQQSLDKNPHKDYETNKIQHRIFLSGTPIINRASEYFTVLNMLAPSHFPSLQRFKRDWLETNDKGQYTHLNRYRVDRFHDLTKRWILRREKTQVLKNLPSFRRDYEYVTIDDPAIKFEYNKQIDWLDTFMNSEGRKDSLSILGELAKLRRITGMAKIQHAIEWTKEWFENAELESQFDQGYPDKLTIGIHHEGVRDNLKLAFDSHDRISESGKFNALKLSGEDSAYKKQQIIDDFSGDKGRRILIANMLAGGIGINLQMCANTLILERQWSAAMEEQFESRFHRNGQTYPVRATYMIAANTIDQFFTELVEEKRKIFGETVSYDLHSDSDGLKELVNRTIQNRL